MNDLYKAAFQAVDREREARAAKEAEALAEHQRACEEFEQRLISRISEFGDLAGLLGRKPDIVHYDPFPSRPNVWVGWRMGREDLFISFPTQGYGLRFVLNDSEANETVWTHNATMETSSPEKFLLNLGAVLESRLRRDPDLPDAGTLPLEDMDI